MNTIRKNKVGFLVLLCSMVLMFSNIVRANERDFDEGDEVQVAVIHNESSNNIDILKEKENDFIVDRNGVLIEYKGSGSNVVIPAEVGGIMVTSIGRKAFNRNLTIHKVSIPEGVKVIGQAAFYQCLYLTEIDLPSTLIRIEGFAFSECPIIELIIPDTVTYIGEYAFQSNCLHKVNISANVASIGIGAFKGESKIENIYVDKNNTTYKDIDGVLYSKDGTKLIVYPEGNKRTEYSIPDSTLVIGESGFESARFLTNIIIPNSVISIKDYAFSRTTINEIRIPINVHEVSNKFMEGSHIENIYVDEENANFKDIDGVLCNKDGTKLLVYPRSNERIQYSIPNSITYIDSYAFYGATRLKEIIIPNSVIEIGSLTFYGCSGLESIIIPSSVKDIQSQAFYYCENLRTIAVLSNDVRYSVKPFEQNDNIFTVYANKGSTTEVHALKYGYSFKELSECPIPLPEVKKPLTSISLNKTNVTYAPGKGTILSVIYNPEDTTDDKTIKWTSSDKSIVIVYSNGKIKGIAPGTASVTATVGNLTATCMVTIK